MRSNIFIVFYLLLGWALFGCKSNAADAPTGGDSNLDKFEELVNACSVWKAGGGASATGGQGTSNVYHVTSLEDKDAFDTNPGTLRYALKQTGKRIIVFDVAGTIELCAPLKIEKIDQGDVSVLGQSAPGQGICLANYPLLIENTQNVIVRFLRFRLGNKSLESSDDAHDAITVTKSRNIMIDHCSASWSVDECVSCYGNENFTLQYCFITESLRNAGHPKGAHGYGGIWGGKNASFHHNLLAHHDSRTPRFDHDFLDSKHNGPIDFVNNVVYNWGSHSAYGGEGSSNGIGGRHINFVNNYFKPGLSTKSNVRTRLVDPWTSCDNCTDACGGSVVPPSIWLEGNVMTSSETVTSNNWEGSTKAQSIAGANARWEEGLTSLTVTENANDAYTTVLEKAGCSLSRDEVDLRIIKNVKENTGGLIDKPSDVGGWPELSEGEAIMDTDADGIPDEWETKYGLNPEDGKDGRRKTLVTGYTNYEVYLNDKVAHLY